MAAFFSPNHPPGALSLARRILCALAVAGIALALWALVEWRSAPPPPPPLPEALLPVPSAKPAPGNTPR